MVASLLDAGLPMARVRRAVTELVAAGHDLAELSLVSDGESVWACRDDGEILDALRHGQLALFVAVDRFADEVDAEVRAFDSDRRAFVETLSERAAHPAQGRPDSPPELTARRSASGRPPTGRRHARDPRPSSSHSTWYQDAR